MNIWRRISVLIERYGLLMLLAIAIAFFSINSATGTIFATTANARNILSNEPILALIVIATVIPLVAGQIDLSVGPTAGLCSIAVAGSMAKHNLPVLVACGLGILVGLVVGTVNGVLVAKAGINSIITTLGTSSIIGAVVLWYSGGLSFQNNISPNLIELGQGNYWGVPKPFVYLVVVGAVVWYVLEHTPSGRNLEASGMNPKAAELVGLRVPRMIFTAFLSAGLIASVTGILLVSVQSAGNPQIGAGFTLPAVAAAFLGATTIRPGRYNVRGAVTAVFFVAVIVNGLTLWGVAGWVSDFVNGISLIAAVGLSVYYSKQRGMATPWRKKRDDESTIPGSELPPTAAPIGDHPSPATHVTHP